MGEVKIYWKWKTYKYPSADTPVVRISLGGSPRGELVMKISEANNCAFPHLSLSGIAYQLASWKFSFSPTLDLK